MTLKLVGSGRSIGRRGARYRDGYEWTVANAGSDQRQSLGAGNALELYFGLGAAESADVTMRWPDGTEQVFGRMAANQRHILTYGESAETDADQHAPWGTICFDRLVAAHTCNLGILFPLTTFDFSITGILRLRYRFLRMNGDGHADDNQKTRISLAAKPRY